MAGQCVAKIKHDVPNCLSSSGKSLQVFLNPDDTFTGFCFACNKIVNDPYGNNPPDPKTIHVKTPEEIEEEIADVKTCPKVPFAHRGLDPVDWDFFGVRMMLSTADGKTPYALAHPYTKDGKVCGYKIKLLHKKTMWNIGDVKGADLYGWERAKRIGGKTIYITEGEEDAIALRKIFRTLSSNDDYDYPVVSLPAGVNSVDKCLGRMAGAIKSRFPNVVIVFDDDEPGRAAVKEALKIFPKAKIARLPEKDANDCLIKGRLKAARDACVFQASNTKDSPIRKASDVMGEILQEPEWGASYPWEDLNKYTYGQRKGEHISWGGGTGLGKTLCIHELAAHNATVHGWRGLLIMMEETNAETYQNISGKIDSTPYHVPRKEGEEPHDKEQLRRTSESLEEYIHVWDIESIEDAESTWSQIEEVIRSDGQHYDYIVIDNATTLSEGLDSSAKNDFLGKVNSSMANLAKKFDFMSVMLSHLNAPANNQRPHECGGVVKESQFTGSRAAMRYSHMIFGFERNKQAVDPNCSILRVLKNRKFGRTGFFKTYYTERTGRLQQRNWDEELYKDATV